jgi:hypothetical protein
MNTTSSYIKEVRSIVDPVIVHAATTFNNFASQVDFTAFCIIYSILLIFLLKKLNQEAIFRPKNR